MKKLAFVAALVATTALTSPASAATLFDDLAAWQAAVGTFTRDTAYGPNFSSIVTSPLDGGATLGINQDVEIRTVGSGWATWSGGYTGQVLYSLGATTVGAQITPVSGFGFFVEPNPFSSHDFTLTLSDGSSITRAFDGSGGAGFLGWAGPGISSFTIGSDVDFAFGDFYTAGAIPEPATWAMMITGFGLLGAAIRRRRRVVEHAMSYI